MRISWPTWQAPQQRREAQDGHEADVELVALVSGHFRRRRDRVRALHDLVVGVHADGHVLAGLEVCRLAVELDPEGGQIVCVIDALDQPGVVRLVFRLDYARVFRVVSHRRDGNWSDRRKPAAYGGSPPRTAEARRALTAAVKRWPFGARWPTERAGRMLCRRALGRKCAMVKAVVVNRDAPQAVRFAGLLRDAGYHVEICGGPGQSRARCLSVSRAPSPTTPTCSSTTRMS